MKSLILSLLLSLSIAISAQETTRIDYSSSLHIGEMMNFGNRSLKFKNVVSDSRCPKDVTCIWAGEAIVAVEVYEDGKCIEEKQITISSKIPLEFSTGNITYNISRLNLSPIPSVKSKDLKKEYKLFLQVSESEKI